MSTTVPPRDGGSLPGGASQPLVLSDETALRQVFFVEYDTLLGDARTALGADAVELAPKVVEGAFVRAWGARDHFATAAELHAFLVADLHHAVARALSRRAAAHRLGGAGARPSHEAIATNAEESWTHVQHALYGEPHSPEVLAEAAAISRHEAAGHIAGISKERPWWIPVGVGILGVALVTGLVFLSERMTQDTRVVAALNGSEVKVVSAPTSQIGNVTLADGSRARLAPETKLTIPIGFGPKLRAVKLDGMATFEVAKGGDAAFQVHAKHGVVVATGTSFTVRSYADDPFETVVVHNGTVELRQGKERGTAAAGDAMVLAAGRPMRKATAEERDGADAWRQGFLMVSNVPLRGVLPLMQRWYGLTIAVKDTTLLTHPVFMRASLDSVRQAIRAIEQSAGVKFGYVGQNMVFEPARPVTKKRK